MFAQASQPILNIAETAMIGRLGATELAARAIGAAIIGSIYWVFAFLTFGTTTLIGHHFGARDRQACGQTYLHALFVALVGGLVVAVAGIAFAEPLYRLLGAETIVIESGANNYFRVYIASAPLTLMVYSSVGFFTSSSEVNSLLTSGVMLLVCALQPFHGMVFVLDGLLIGARDTRYLMWAMLAGAAILIAIAWSSLQFGWGLMGILSAISALMLWRSATNFGRFFNQKWATW